MGNFECFKESDVYALGLVLWEICQRSIPSGREKPLDLEFRLPYRYVNQVGGVKTACKYPSFAQSLVIFEN